jgi:hypothetical protein
MSCLKNKAKQSDIAKLYYGELHRMKLTDGENEYIEDENRHILNLLATAEDISLR